MKLLTVKECDTMSLLVEGKHYKEIASEEGVKHQTIVTRCARVRSKMRAKTREQAAAMFLRRYG